jgi:hypothetical protein
MADTPFGLSFGNPSKYMGQSPLAEIGKAAKTGLMAYGLQKSGAVDWLNKQGLSQNKQGNWGYNAPAGAAAPPVGASGADMDMMSSGYGPAVPPQESAPSAFVAPNEMPAAPQMQMTPPSDIGNKILEGDDSWQHSSVNPQAERDSLVLPQQTGYNQMQATGNEYQQVPGYGSLKKAASMMMMG